MTKNLDKPPMTVQALSSADWDLLRKVKEEKEAEAATKGSGSWRIASAIWSPVDAMTRLTESSGYADHLRVAHHGAIAMRVFTLGCHQQALNHLEALEKVAAYSNAFHELGRLKCPRWVFHTGLMETLDHSGFRVEIEEAADDEYNGSPFNSMLNRLYGQNEELGCKNLLDWICVRQGSAEGRFDNKKFNDYTNLLMRLDAGLPNRRPSSTKLRLHRGDFASYMRKILSGMTPKGILNPVTTDTFTLTGTDGYAYAVDQKYDEKDSRTNGQGYFNPNHDYDELEHKLIDRAMKSYAAGSSWFWNFFALCSMLDACALLTDPNPIPKAQIIDIIKARATNWLQRGKTLPIRRSMIDVAETFAIAYLNGLAEATPSAQPSAAPSEPAPVWVAGPNNSWVRGPVMQPGETKSTEPKSTKPKAPKQKAPKQKAPSEARDDKAEDKAEGKADKDGFITITKAGRNPGDKITLNFDLPTQPGRVNCTTPMAAAAEHREAMRNQFYL